MIYHMLPLAVWQQQAANQPYRHASLVAEGFIHCTAEPERLLWVANHFYQAEAGDFVILCIDETAVQALVQWERADGHLFPHIYGPLNLGAVRCILHFPRAKDGRFLPPPL
jgi:uncharacterized protein (DUF952 family)